MGEYKHSVSLDVEKCKGCTNCLKRCPTEAIRIRDGHAQISSLRCIDCGECIKVCPYKAKKAIYDKISSMEKYKWKIALPAPSLYGQFDNLEDIDYVLQGLLDYGFDEVYEVSRTAELVSGYTRRYLKREGIKKPVISSACPVVVRLISLRYAFLCENVMPILPPMEIAAMLAKAQALATHPELKPEDIGTCFISPCPAKVSYVKNGFDGKKSHVDCVLSINDVYFGLIGAMKHITAPPPVSKTGMIGVGWASTGGEATAIFNDKYLAADGIENVIRVLDEIDNGALPDLEFIELNACTGGCVGGVMTIENPYIAKARLQTLKRYLPVSQNWEHKLNESETFIPEDFLWDDELQYSPVSKLDGDRKTAMRKMAEIEKIRKMLPCMDCGACGCPSCATLAEDIVKGKARLEDCVVLLKEKYLAESEEEEDDD
ncbi:MAG: 4Fe-4S dicluster domain-containing protein [Clostridia bacterium]|nr:4Fe-4S dicluster domain-containing protein [Clostridia bacterium]